jgi:hypothetical protein
MLISERLRRLKLDRAALCAVGVLTVQGCVSGPIANADMRKACLEAAEEHDSTIVVMRDQGRSARMSAVVVTPNAPWEAWGAAGPGTVVTPKGGATVIDTTARNPTKLIACDPPPKDDASD